MSAVVVDGKILAKRIQDNLIPQAEVITHSLGRKPGLAVILVGDNPASKVYVSAKTKTARACGLATFDIHLPANTTDKDLKANIQKLNQDPNVDGILLQLPLPAGLNEFSALNAILPEKDVDGLHPFNQGLLLRGELAPRPCTPLGVLALVDEARSLLKLPKNLNGLKATIVGRSVLVGKPLAFLLLERHCTVTLCHSQTTNLQSECASADILIAALGKPNFIQGNAVKPNSIVIDVGINKTPNGKLTGDVDFPSAQKIAAAITPVPGGVGPMTIAMLMSNTVEAARKISSPTPLFNF